MKAKEVLLFIGKCLTINQEVKNKKEIEVQLKTTQIDWDTVVQISTKHLVFPALYCNLKNANLLAYLPEDLVGYMQYITNINRDRNTQIIAQAIEINTLLVNNNITPIFIKGTANLLNGLYEDIAERMVGDIDFLVLKDAEKADEILKENGYTEFYSEDILVKNHRHLPRIVHPSKIAAIEIHTKVLAKNYDDQLNYFDNSTFVTKENITFFNAKYSLIITILSKQINDNGFDLKKINLKVCYDVFLQSKKTNVLALLNASLPFFKITNNYVGITSLIFNHPASLAHVKNKYTSIKYLNLYFTNSSFFKKLSIKVKAFYITLLNFITKKSYRNYFIGLIKSKLNS